MLPRQRLLSLIAALALASPGLAQQAEYSQLWGEHGEDWNAQSRLPDFSYAGYHHGERELPEVKQVTNVRDFGAVGDGETDDTAAIQKAIDATENGALYFPPGRYKLTEVLHVKRSNVVLRGAGPDQTELWCPMGLNEIDPVNARTSTGKKTSPYSFGSGFINVTGDYREQTLARIVAEAQRGDDTVQVASTDGLEVGQRVRVIAHETEDQSLKTYLYSGDPGDIRKGKDYGARMVMRIVAIDGNRVRFNRPLRYPTRTEWQPEIVSFRPTITEVGIEDLRFTFPNRPYEGHFKEMGCNAIEMNDVSDCWIRNVRIHNGDLGINLMGCGNTLDQIVISADPERGMETAYVQSCTGHHGIQLKHAQDNLVTRFDFRTSYIHDLSLEDSSGNVFSAGRGDNLALDHHKDTSHENLFTDIDCGKGTRVWYHGGGHSLGRPCAAWGTFWNLHADTRINPPPVSWGPKTMNFVGLRSQLVQNSVLEPDGWWIETIHPAKLQPQDLHQAQLERRLEQQ